MNPHNQTSTIDHNQPMKRILSLFSITALVLLPTGCVEESVDFQSSRFYNAITNAAYLQGRNDERMSNDQLLQTLTIISRVQGELHTNQMFLNRAQVALAQAVVRLSPPPTNKVEIPTNQQPTTKKQP